MTVGGPFLSSSACKTHLMKPEAASSGRRASVTHFSTNSRTDRKKARSSSSECLPTGQVYALSVRRKPSLRAIRWRCRNERNR